MELIQNWFDACDKRGIDVNTQLDYMINLHNFLMDKIQLGTYITCMTHVKGIPIVTFEAFLQTISTQIF